MNKTMHRPKIDWTTTDAVFRSYDVTLMPSADPEEAYEPIRVVLRYTVEQADALDALSTAAKAEAFRRAEKIERRDHETPAGRTFFMGEVRMVRATLRKAK